MKDAKKNRDPERARKRAKSDARCALRKACLLESIEEWHAERRLCGPNPTNRASGAALLETLAEWIAE